MKTTGVLVVALVAVAGVLVAVLAVGRAAPRAEGQRAAGGGEESGELTAELERLRSSVEALGARIERLELARPAAVSPVSAGGARSAVDAVTRAELEALRAELAALRAPAGGGPAVSADFERQVLGVLEAQERREEAERADARREAALTRIEERVAELAGELGLSSFQSGELLAILTDEDQRREAFFGRLREGAFDRAGVRDGMEELRATTETALQGVLSADQYERYLQSSSGGPFGFDFGPGRGSRRTEGDRGRGER